VNRTQRHRSLNNSKTRGAHGPVETAGKVLRPLRETTDDPAGIAAAGSTGAAASSVGAPTAAVTAVILEMENWLNGGMFSADTSTMTSRHRVSDIASPSSAIRTAAQSSEGQGRPTYSRPDGFFLSNR